MAAVLYQLDVQASEVRDDPTNFTRFIVFAHKQDLPLRANRPDSEITTLVFQARSVPSVHY